MAGKKRESLWNPTEEQKTWNVKQAEEDIWRVSRYEIFFSSPEMEKAGKNILKQICRNEEYLEKITAAAKEMHDIISDKENSSGFHLNHISSGKTVYGVFNNEDAKEYVNGGFFATQEEAEAEAAKYPDAYVENDGLSEDENTPYHVWVMDEEGSERLKASECGGEWVGDFDTEEEAEKEAEAYKYSYIVEYPSEEWWAVIDNRTGKNAYRMLFPHRTRALAFLYAAAKPKAWMDYISYLDSTEKGA